jgi:hypothetical protein
MFIAEGLRMNSAWCSKVSLALLVVFSSSIYAKWYTPTMRKGAVAAFIAFIVGSLRLAAKGKCSTEQQYTWSDPLKFWNVFSREYWEAYDEQIFGTIEIIRKKTVIKYNEEKNCKEKYDEEEKVQRATGIYGYYIFKCGLKPLKKLYDVIKPFKDVMTLLEAIYFSSYLV